MIADTVAEIGVTERAIVTLMALNIGGFMSEKERKEWENLLRKRSVVLKHMYENDEFVVMVDETLLKLEQYQGRQIATEQQFRRCLQHLRKYGWVVSLRMWSREEIVIMCIILWRQRESSMD